MNKIKQLLRRLKAQSQKPAVLLHLQRVSQFEQPDQIKIRCTITQTVAVPLHTLIEGKFFQGKSVRFPVDFKMPMITWTGRCKSEAVSKSRNFWGHHKDGGYVYSDGPATYLEWN
jgi:hypothetical protein